VPSDSPEFPELPGTDRSKTFWHAIISARSTRSATCDAKQAQPTARPHAVTGNRFISIFRTGRNVTARISDKAGKRQLIEPNEAHAE
jgi:hypothetical protein